MRETIPVTRPYDAAWVLRFLGARALPGVERVVGSTWQRATLISGRPALLSVDVGARALEIETPVPLDPPDPPVPMTVLPVVVAVVPPPPLVPDPRLLVPAPASSLEHP